MKCVSAYGKYENDFLGALILTKFFLGAVSVKIYPHFPIAVILYTWIAFIVKPVQSTADHCMNLHTQIQ